MRTPDPEVVTSWLLVVILSQVMIAFAIAGWIEILK